MLEIMLTNLKKCWIFEMLFYAVVYYTVRIQNYFGDFYESISSTSI